jgi:hypothetical protein
VKRTPWVGDPVHERMPPGFNKPVLTEVVTYVIETADLRLELQDMVAVGREGFDLSVTIGRTVTFAVEKKTAYRYPRSVLKPHISPSNDPTQRSSTFHLSPSLMTLRGNASLPL